MEEPIQAEKRTRIRYAMLSLVFVNVVINYLDRSNMSVAGPVLSDELNLSSVELGLIFSAFGWSYAILQIPGGVLADRFAPRVLYTVCLVAWSLTTVAQGLSRGFVGLFGFRMATGVFEAPSYPVNNRIVTSWFPEHERAGAIATYVSGQFIGLAFLTPVLAAIQFYAGWRGLFFAAGSAGLLWGIVWYIFYRDPLDHPKVNKAELDYIEKGGGHLTLKKRGTDNSPTWQWSDYKAVIASRNLWGVFIGHFCVNSILWFFLTWFPTYLVKYRGLDYTTSGFLASIPYLGACGGVLLSGFLSDYLVRKGVSLGTARKAPMIVGLLLSMSIAGANYTDDTTLVISIMTFAFFGAGMALIAWVFVSLLSPKHLIGLTGGVFNFMGNLASILIPIAVGVIAQAGSFKPALAFIGTLGLIGACSYMFVLGKIRLQTPAATEPDRKE